MPTLLGGVELKGTRYTVMVSERDLSLIEDVERNGTRYRAVGVPVDPQQSSTSARKIAAKWRSRY
jgi:hypothetical protein